MDCLAVSGMLPVQQHLAPNCFADDDGVRSAAAHLSMCHVCIGPMHLS